jgi:hypothetical protein
MSDYRTLRAGDTSLQDWRERAAERAQQAVRECLTDPTGSLATQLEELKQEFAADLARQESEVVRGFETMNDGIDRIVADHAQQLADLEQRVMVKFIERFLSSGLAVKTLAVCGTFDAHEHYRMLDTVALNGASFIAKHDNPGPCPGEGWQLLAQKGQRGVAGDKGERGPASC